MRNLFIAVCFVSLLCSVAWAADYGDVVVSRVVSVYDGDTFRVDIDGWPPMIGRNMPVRIAEIDCPEMRGQNADKVAATFARNQLQDLLEKADLIELRNIRRGKYFRLVSDVFVDGVDIKELTVCGDY